MTVGIIGAGASGMAAALAASDNPQTQVILMERQARVGRKLLATGNGRCNLSNLHAEASHYHGEEAAFCAAALTRYSTEETLEWFHSLGLYTVAEPSGRIYPYSDQANSVVDVLRFALDRPNVHLLTGFEVSRIRKNSCGFTVESGAERVTCEKLIIACGGLAGTKLGGSMAGYKLLRSMGHRATKLRPALVQLRSSWAGFTSLKGVRANCCAEILHDGKLFAQSIGELQFTEYGLSGPVIFEISRDVCAQPGRWICRMDFLPDHCEEDLIRELHRRRNTGMPAEELLTGVLHNRLGRVLTQAVGIRPQQSSNRLEDGQLRMLAAAVKSFEVELTEPLGMDSAQVTAGGIMTVDFDPETMESRLVPGLYACGEVLDVDGDCGGYNLQWAWSSGRLAGSCAGRE